MVRVPSPPQSWSQAVVCVSTPRMYPRSGYFLVIKLLRLTSLKIQQSCDSNLRCNWVLIQKSPNTSECRKSVFWRLLFWKCDGRCFFWLILNFWNNLNNYFRLHLCLSFRTSVRTSVRHTFIFFYFLQLFHKMSLIKVAWHVLRVKNMHPGSPSVPSGNAAAEAKLRCV